jgi:prepilin-type N-terminal cleavage/methylation domain-containing protein
MSPTNVNPKEYVTRAGFTLVELMVGVTLSAIIFAGILGGFTFLGRNLTRLVNSQEQEAKSRRAFYLLGQDISAATKVESTATDSSIQLTVQGRGTVRYAYDPLALTFSRTAPVSSGANASITTVLLTNLSALNFKYYNQAGNLLALTTADDVDLAKSGIQSVKEIELSFASAVGNAPSGTRSVFAGKSPRFVLRNRPLLQ